MFAVERFLKVSEPGTFTTLGLPAGFVASNWQTGVEDTDEGCQLSIDFELTNTGDLAGSYQLSLAVNGVDEEVREISLNVGQSTPVTFIIVRSEPGTYSVSVADLTTSFKVPAPVSTTANLWFVVAVCTIVLFIASGLFSLWRLKKAQTMEKPPVQTPPSGQ